MTVRRSWDFVKWRAQVVNESWPRIKLWCKEKYWVAHKDDEISFQVLKRSNIYPQEVWLSTKHIYSTLFYKLNRISVFDQSNPVSSPQSHVTSIYTVHVVWWLSSFWYGLSWQWYPAPALCHREHLMSPLWVQYPQWAGDPGALWIDMWSLLESSTTINIVAWIMLWPVLMRMTMMWLFIGDGVTFNLIVSKTKDISIWICICLKKMTYLFLLGLNGLDLVNSNSIQS